MTINLNNISLQEFREFLRFHGLKPIRTKGGHEIWSGKDLLRPIVLQTHVDPIPLFVIKNNLRTMKLTISDLRKFLERKD